MKISEYKSVPLFDNTKEWFKRDIDTIKKSTIKTLKVSPLIIGSSFFLTTIVYYLLTNQLNFTEIFVYFLIMTPILVLGFFLLHVMQTKGYDITVP